MSDVLLSEARALLESKLDEGTTCPCCDKFCKIYKRKFNSTMARSVIWIVRFYEEVRRWIDIPNEGPRFIIKTNQLGTAAHWGVLSTLPVDEDDDARRTSGMWRPTELGIEFVYKKRSIPSHMYEYNNVPLEFIGSTDIEKALGRHFSYRELMEKAL